MSAMHKLTADERNRGLECQKSKRSESKSNRKRILEQARNSRGKKFYVLLCKISIFRQYPATTINTPPSSSKTMFFSTPEQQIRRRLF